MGRPCIHFFGLREVANQGSRVYLGTIARSREDDRIVLTIERTFTSGGVQGPTRDEQPGSTITLSMHVAVVPRSPLESFQDHRLIGGMQDATVGTRVIAVRGELLPASPENVRKLEILFGATRYEPDPRDLSDHDLCQLAYEGLAANKRLRDEDVVRAEPEIVERHFRGLATADRRRFVKLAAHDAEVAKAIVRVVLAVRDDAVLAEMPALLEGSPAIGAEFWSGISQWDYAAGPENAPDFSAIADVFPLTRFGSDDLFSRLFERVDAPSKVRLMRRVLQKPSNEGARALQATVPFVAKIPSPDLLDDLRRIDPNTPNWGWTSIAGTSLLEMVTAIVRAHPEAMAGTQRWLEPMLAAGISASNESTGAWRELAGPPPALPALPTGDVALADGEHRYDPSGFWAMRAGGVIEVQRGVERRRLQERFDESTFGSEVLVMSEKGKLRFIPSPGLTHWDDAKAIADRTANAAGCGQLGEGQQAHNSGVMTFTSAQKCTIRVALFTDRIDVEHGEHA
ncbi:MAG: hypothetical protein ACXWUG_10425 [Polyangiales bacterium]